MRPVSAAFLRVLRGSHQMDARATIVTSFQTGTAPSGTEVGVISGDVTHDGTADIRATADLKVSGDWAEQPDGLLTPYGNEVFIERAVKYGGGSREWVSQGYFRLNSVEQPDAPWGEIRLAGADRMCGIVDARLVSPRQYLPADSVEDVFTDLVLEVYPAATIQYDFDAAGTLLGRSLIADQDRYGFLRDLATGLGKILYWDYRGFLIVASPPDPTVPVFEVNSGAGGVLVTLSRKLSRDGVYNAVVASGEAGDDQAPARAVARDMNPASATFWDGRFGKVPRFYSSPFLTTDAQAQSAAESLLRKVVGLPYSVDFTAVPNPALEPLDSVRITHPDRSEVHILETVKVPLSPLEALSATTREQTDVIIEVDGT